MSDATPEDESQARETEVTESDPNADSGDGLAGGMGVSSERVGEVRGEQETGSYGTDPTATPDPDPEDAPPEQSLERDHGEELDERPPPYEKGVDRL